MNEPRSHDQYRKLGGTGARVLITHDWLVTWGGAERVLDELAALFPDADIVTAIRQEGVALEHSTAYRASELWVGKLPGARNHHQWFVPVEAQRDQVALASICVTAIRRCGMHGIFMRPTCLVHRSTDDSRCG